MNKQGARIIYMLLGGAVAAAPVDHTCLPYTKPPSTAADVNLTDALVALPSTAANTNLCEEFT